MDFRTEVFGKWILVGEHSVLRGSPALVFPLKSRSLVLTYRESDQPLTTHFGGPRGEEMRLLFWGVWERALELSGQRHSSVQGEFSIESTLPVGAGMGASATLCVAISRWFEWRGWLQTNDLYEFARRLEDLFHGESSGVDIAVALAGQPLHFERNGARQFFAPQWQPQWFLSYSGARGITAECVAQVKSWMNANPQLGQATDQMMRESVAQCEEALTRPAAEGAELLCTAIDQAHQCFERWGLTHGDLGTHIEMLRQHGAATVKPTGSGNGGYVLSVWQQTPPESLRNRLIAL